MLHTQEMLLIKIKFLCYVRRATLVIKKLIVDNLVIFLFSFESLLKFSCLFAILAKDANFLIVREINKLFLRVSEIDLKNFLHVRVAQCHVNKYVVNLNVVLNVQWHFVFVKILLSRFRIRFYLIWRNNRLRNLNWHKILM